MEILDKDKSSPKPDLPGSLGKRHLSNWIDSWVKFTDTSNSPTLFRRWTAIGVVSAVLERKVWTVTNFGTLYPNMYIVLVGPPGVGKGRALSPARALLRNIPDHFLAPSSSSPEGFIDRLAEAKRKVIRFNCNPSYIEFHCLNIISTEFQNLLPEYAPKFMGILTDIYDGEPYDYSLRTGKVHIKIDAPLISILAGTTPSYLNSFLPEGAWDQGFTSRTIFVFAGQQSHADIFSSGPGCVEDQNLQQDLTHDLKEIAALTGIIVFSEEAKDAIVKWQRAGLPPIPEHGNLVHYNTRRLNHCIKLCMALSAGKRDSLTVEADDFYEAVELLVTVEAFMPDIFRFSGGAGSDSRAIEDTWYFVFKEFAKTKKPVLEHRLVFFLKERVPSYSISKLIETMVQAHMLVPRLINGLTAYEPGNKDPQ